MKHNMLRNWLACGLVLLIGLVWGCSASAQNSISGFINNGSLWENLSAPVGLGPAPGDGSGTGRILVSLMLGDGTLETQTNAVGALPLGAGPYPFTFNGPFIDETYTIVAWIDANNNSVYDFGEPKGVGRAIINLGVSVVGRRVLITDDFDADGLPDWWETHWFIGEVDPMAFTGANDPDADGLTNLEEYHLSVLGTTGILQTLNPADWDTDGDGMDDGWECRYFDPNLLTGMNAIVSNVVNDYDGDGLSDWQEYCGVDGYPRMVFDQFLNSISRGRLNPQALVSDDLNPLDIDTDFDMLLDSFEAAWYDPANRINPRVGTLSQVPLLGVDVDTTIAREDSDQDGLSNFREQCLMAQLHQATTNGWLWDWVEEIPFHFQTYEFQGVTRRLCTMASCGGQSLSLNLVMGGTIPASTNRFMLRTHGWTDPTESTGYVYVDEDIPTGHDTDDDGLPDGWEVQFSLDPRDDGFGGTWDQGPFGDPDNDGLMNIDEFYGQDGNRSATRRYINGTGDESNPYHYNWRPDSTYPWRWIDTDVSVTTAASERELGDPRLGTGISRVETLGSALPSISLGVDNGTDTDDDGFSDADEISPANSVLPSSPVDSCDPFISRSALIVHAGGIAIPDPEPEPVAPSAGWRPDLQRRDWTLECHVKLMATNLTGNLFNFQTIRGPKVCTVYRLSLSNNAPVLISDNTLYKPIMVSANPLPTNRWVQLAAVWDHKNNSLGLYVDGILSMAPMQLTESFSEYLQGASNRLVLAESPNGSFVNQLFLDEVRVWGVARTAAQVGEYARQLVPSVCGDDVWLNQESLEYYSPNDTPIVNGGGLFDGEPGVALESVYSFAGNYWIDDGDGQYNSARDTVLQLTADLPEGSVGKAVGNVVWNDRDHSGDFTRSGLLAYYRFDDGGGSVEDFARRAKNGLLGATDEEFRFGDQGYALATNHFVLVTNGAAQVYGVDKRGGDDTDSDGMPDGWEVSHGLDLWENGTRGETYAGAKDGPSGAKGDLDQDGLINIYEYWAGTNPRFLDSDGDGILDSQEDRDGDGVVNITEQMVGSRPDIVDTDDDGLTDSEEQGVGTSPINAVDPATSRAVVLTGGAGNFLEIPGNFNQRLRDWTIEAWAMPSNVSVGAGVIVRRVVENLAGGTKAVNYVMGLETNGAGGLRLYAGYVWPDGAQYFVRGGTVLTGEWMHLAASYSQSSATLILYTNGFVAGSTNTFSKEPPISGRGGETFVRMGEGFGGGIDEVRLWSKVRTAAQIQANTNLVISVSDTNGLINYFRFDDGVANTNQFGWSEYHQSAGYQDFSYGNDWNEQWRHAAITHGPVEAVVPGAIIPPPTLRVILRPDTIVPLGAQWSVDGGEWQNSSDSVQGLTPGSHTVMYKSILGWTKPASESVLLTNGVATSFVRTYVQQASLVIRFDDVTAPAGAAWRINGGDWNNAGTVVSNINAGTVTVSYKPVDGYFQPEDESIILAPGATLQLLREYAAMISSVSAIIIPTNAVTEGAQWRVDGGPWLNSGDVAGGLLVASHVIEYLEIPQWITPPAVTVFPASQRTLMITGQYTQVTIAGQINNGSLWRDILNAPPGNGDGQGQMMVGILQEDGSISDAAVVTNGALPFAAGLYNFSFGGALADGTYTVIAWIDGNGDSEKDDGEPFGKVTTVIVDHNSVSTLHLNLVDDSDDDGLPDWWEYHWFQYAATPLAASAGDDLDKDGLTNLEEYRLSSDGHGFDYLNPADWDTDGDGMDDGWECAYFNTEVSTTSFRMGLNPVLDDDTSDYDGDGLSNWQEYGGIDGKPNMIFDKVEDGVHVGKIASSDDLSPIDIDTDNDALFDSFEASWYDPENKIDPRVGTGSVLVTNSVSMDTSIAEADSDQDGLSNYREQCLLGQLRESSTNGVFWNWGLNVNERLPFIHDWYVDTKGKTRRICTMTTCHGVNLNLSVIMGINIPTMRHWLRDNEWTDPTEGTGYFYEDENIPPGHDTDADGLPDGWEVQFSLDARDDGLSGVWDNGPFGDPDGDGLMNIEEYNGQDGNRSVTKPYVNGTGDETNPNRYNWRPDSTASELGIRRKETLGSALPTTSLGVDLGTDSDDDGITDSAEINPVAGRLPSSPVDSCDPFIQRSALIISSNGIPIPDPEMDVVEGIRPGGMRPDLQGRDWTLECQVKLLGTNLSGDLFNFQTVYGPNACIVYRLSLSNNAPVLVSDNSAFTHVTILANALPTNRWVHLAAVWDHANNYLALYIDGVLSMAPLALGESFSQYMYPATNQLALAVSTNGSFINSLMLDEVRIWGVARTAQQISDNAFQLILPETGDDVWIDQECPQFYSHTDTVIVNGGGLFGGEPGVPLENVCVQSGTFWVDDGDGQYNAARDVIIAAGSNLVEGLTGALVGNVLWNDRDGSGDFTRRTLLAYYRFDDGGATAEDFARPAKNGLIGATSENYRFGDHGYALSASAFAWVTNEPSLVYGVDKRGADDSDFDGLPDAWELIHALDMWDDGTWGETLEGAKDGPNGPKGDLDHDGLVNLYEFWAGTNPRFIDSDGDGVLDTQEDRDGDGAVNITEQLLGSRPDMIDTDDDGYPDNEEQSMGTSPINPVDPAISRAAAFGGAMSDYLEIPVALKQRLSNWTFEGWVNPSNAVDGVGILMRRVVENLGNGTQAVNYIVGLEPAVGGLGLYAGYIWPDGRQYILRGGVIPAVGGWTHVAASYNRINATMSLYTNGALAAMTNTFYDEPPMSGRGGETFVRVGEGFAGRVDEIRLWSTIRSEGLIQANTNRVISMTDTNGLIAYFRFDDGQATTNLFPWSEYHQPGGFQDFNYEKDWNAQWRHAAILHGNVQVTGPGAIVPPPSLRLILQPDAVVLGGAQWSVDGGGWQNSGDSVQGLSPGTHTVLYKSVVGWTKPGTETVILTNAGATTLIRSYIQQANLVVRFDYASTPESAAWQVNGGGWLAGGVVVSNLTSGTNVITYLEVDGYFSPPDEDVVLIPGTTLELLREYAVITSAVSVVIMPTNAVADGAQWRVDGGGWQNSGQLVNGLLLGPHIIEFSTPWRWIPPDNITVSLLDENPVVVTGLYSQVTGLSADIFPPAAIATGAMWRVAGGVWTNSGVLLNVAAGTYTVQFKPIGENWLQPGDITAVVVDQRVTVVSGTYFPVDIFGGNVSTNLGEFLWPYGVTLDAQHRIYVSDTFNNRVQMYTPLSRTWSILGASGSGVGQFNQPCGIILDSRGTLYVADRNNNRVQKRNPTNFTWSIVGSNNLGSALGQFNSPADVAVDSSFNLYVADFANDRVQRLSTSGVWSVFVTNGVTAGRVSKPQGLTVDGTDNVYVADRGANSNSLSRVQKFAKNGAFVALLGDHQVANGGLSNGVGMVMGEAGALYLADVLNNRVASLPVAGGWATLVGGAGLNNPQDVSWDPRGYLYIADTLNSRILRIAITQGVLTNGITQLSASMPSGTNTSFMLSWFANSNWFYAVQYVNSLADPVTWQLLPGCTNIAGFGRMTNCTDTTVLGVTNRYYRIIAY